MTQIAGAAALAIAGAVATPVQADTDEAGGGELKATPDQPSHEITLRILPVQHDRNGLAEPIKFQALPEIEYNAEWTENISTTASFELQNTDGYGMSDLSDRGLQFYQLNITWNLDDYHTINFGKWEQQYQSPWFYNFPNGRPTLGAGEPGFIDLAIGGLTGLKYEYQVDLDDGLSLGLRAQAGYTVDFLNKVYGQDEVQYDNDPVQEGITPLAGITITQEIDNDTELILIGEAANPGDEKRFGLTGVLTHKHEADGLSSRVVAAVHRRHDRDNIEGENGTFATAYYQITDSWQYGENDSWTVNPHAAFAFNRNSFGTTSVSAEIGVQLPLTDSFNLYGSAGFDHFLNGPSKGTGRSYQFGAEVNF